MGKMEDNNSRWAIDTIANDVREKIHYLIKEGYSPIEIQSWINESVIPGGITITKDYRILLSESGHEIKMRPLAKSLYLFFLKHESGCRMKELPQHENEILRIYNRLTVFDDVQGNRRRIARLVDPLSKSFLEQSSVIRRLFMNELNDLEAQKYCISGGRGETRRIQLDRGHVKWNVEI